MVSRVCLSAQSSNSQIKAKAKRKLKQKGEAKLGFKLNIEARSWSLGAGNTES